MMALQDRGAAPAQASPDAARAAAAERLFAMLYADLRQLASSRLREAGEITQLNTTELLHESFLRLRQAEPGAFPNKQHFLGYAARAIRSVVVDLVRSRSARRHGGDLQREWLNTDLNDELDSMPAHEDEVLRVNEALAELADAEPRLATVVELRYFGGLTETEVAAALGLTLRTVQRDWAKARLFLSLALK